jgi:hypothetical protein
MRTDQQFHAAGWTRPTIRLDPESTAALAVLTKRAGVGASEVVRQLILADFKKSTRRRKYTSTGDVT